MLYSVNTVLQGFYCTKIWTAFLQLLPTKFQQTKRVTIENLLFGKLRAFSPLLSSFKCSVVMKGTVLQFHCVCIRAKVDCTLHCHGQNGGAQWGDSAAPSGTCRLALNTKRIAPPGAGQNLKRRRANSRGDIWEKTASDSISAEDSTNDGT